MLVDPPIADRDDVEFGFVEHLPVVGIRVGYPETLRGPCTAGFILVGNSDHLNPGNIEPSNVQIVTVAASGGPADYPNSVLLSHAAPPLRLALRMVLRYF